MSNHQPNPLFPDHPAGPHRPAAAGHAPRHAAPAHHTAAHHQPAHPSHAAHPSHQPQSSHGHHAKHPASQDSSQAAVDLIRQKLERIYTDAPDTQQEIAVAEAAGPHRSRHQDFIHQLTSSGKSLAHIQTEWHHYYSSLPDDEKHAVWQEFYSRQSQAVAPALQPYHGAGLQHTAPAAATGQAAGPDGHAAIEETGEAEAEAPAPAQPRVPHSVYPTPTVPLHTADKPPTDASSEPADSQPTHEETKPEQDDREPADIRQQLLGTVSQRAKLKPRHHVQSLLFGLGCGGLALLVVLFSFFNEMFIAPFIQPSRTVNATPIIIGTDGVAPTQKAEVIIPKINVQIPLDFSAKTIREDDIQRALENGVVHYPTTPLPGQNGNTAFFGHSSNNIFNPGKYKFAFVLLRELVPGDTFHLTRDGVAYTYQVFDKKVIDPTEISILNPIPGKTATATLITCDPPGTTLKRLAVIGEQVSPNPAGNDSAAAPRPADGDKAGEDARNLPGPAPSLWRRLTDW